MHCINHVYLVKSTTSAHDVAEAAERALRITSPVLLAQPAAAPATGVLEQLITLAGKITK